jgi:fatty acid desaturase
MPEYEPAGAAWAAALWVALGLYCLTSWVFGAAGVRRVCKPKSQNDLAAAGLLAVTAPLWGLIVVLVLILTVLGHMVARKEPGND